MQKWILLILLSPLGALFAQPHAVFVIGTPHYNPGSTMPPLAKQLERFGFRTTVVLPEGNPEKNPKGIPGLAIGAERNPWGLGAGFVSNR